MDILGRLLSGGDLRAGTPGPTDDFWYGPVGQMTAAGVRVDGETAKKISAWYRGRDILATVVAMLPLLVMERLSNDGGSQPATSHPLYDILHDKPNASQDSFQWRRQQMYSLIDTGSAFNWILPGARGAVDQLEPITPSSRVTRRRITSGAYRGRILYDVKDPVTSKTTTHTQDEIFDLMGASEDGLVSKGILDYARGSLGTAAATESYAASIYSNGVLNGGWVKVPGSLDPEAARRLAKSLVTKRGEHNLPKVLEQGAEITPNPLTPEHAQMLESRGFSVDDMARWLGVPRLMLENSDPSYGNAEQFTQNFIDINMGGWLGLWEFACNNQLILARAKYFTQFRRQAFVRANYKDRVAGHVAFVNAGIETVDEARDVEDMPKRGGKADELREPQNITGKPAAEDPTPEPQPQRRPAPKSTKAEAIAVESAARLLRKEVTAIRNLAVRHAADSDAFAAAVSDFYAKHVELVSQSLLMSLKDAEAYCASQASQVVSGDWVVALGLWSTDLYSAGLAGLALEEVA